MDVMSFWTHHVPGGLPTLATLTFGVGMGIFMHLEGLSHSEAAYASVVAGTTIGYGDITPTTDMGKICVALYSLLVINVMGACLEPAREFLEGLCHVEDFAAANDTVFATDSNHDDDIASESRPKRKQKQKKRKKSKYA